MHPWRRAAVIFDGLKRFEAYEVYKKIAPRAAWARRDVCPCCAKRLFLRLTHWLILEAVLKVDEPRVCSAIFVKPSQFPGRWHFLTEGGSPGKMGPLVNVVRARRWTQSKKYQSWRLVFVVRFTTLSANLRCGLEVWGAMSWSYVGYHL